MAVIYHMHRKLLSHVPVDEHLLYVVLSDPDSVHFSFLLDTGITVPMTETPNANSCQPISTLLNRNWCCYWPILSRSLCR